LDPKPDLGYVSASPFDMTRYRVFFGLVLGLAALGAGALVSAYFQQPRASRTDFKKDVQPVLSQYCYGCHNAEKHKGGLSLAAFTEASAVRTHPKAWNEVLRKLRDREMPPEGKPQPSDLVRERIAGWIDVELFPIDPAHPDPGRVTIRRLNRAEYNNTIRDLLGVKVRPADDFPVDDTGYGFDNIGDVLSLSPLLLEKYLAAAEKILEAAFADEGCRRRIFIAQPTASTTNQCLSAVLGNFGRRAFRRPVDKVELERLVQFAQRSLQAGESFDRSVRTTLEAILISPHFLFRGELQPEPNNARQVRALDDYALASRLSYFLWSSMPDDELLALAEKGRLRADLETQVRRMLRDPKAQALADNFAGQWLQLRNLKLAAPDPKTFPAFDEDLRTAMGKETELFFNEIVGQDRSIIEFLTADYTFANERLARHYGISGVTGAGFQRISLKDTRRGGVLTHASVLTVTSNPNRTSPVKRGKWVLENLLAQAPPPPPANVPPLGEGKEESASASLRQRMERHRLDPLCASCHAQMDPIGFSLENFDGIGQWRDRDGTFPVESSGQFKTGEHFSGAGELCAVLARQRRAEFVRCLSEKLLTYALGRGLEYYDRPAVEQMANAAARRDFRFSALVLGVVRSVPFQMRRGEAEGPPPELAQSHVRN
jgi:hypothetical protein